MSDINQLKHFDTLDYKGEYFTNELKDGEEFLYSTIKIQDDSKVTFLCKYNKNKHIQSCNYCLLVKYLCLGIDCHAVILKQIKYEKKNLNLLVMAKEMVVLTIGYINKFLKLLLYFLLMTILVFLLLGK
jgi:hypothetical protein